MKRGEKGNIFFLPRVRGGGGGGGGLTGAFEREGGQEIIQSRKRREKPANVALSPLSLNILYSRGKKIAHVSLSSFRTHSLKVGGGRIRVISRGGPLSGKSRGGKTCCLRSYGKHFRGGGGNKAWTGTHSVVICTYLQKTLFSQGNAAFLLLSPF